VLIDYYIYRECIEVTFMFQGRSIKDVFEGGLEGMVRHWSRYWLLKASELGCQQQWTDIEKVAEEMLLCEVIVQFGYA
jgi:hypothetical protein